MNDFIPLSVPNLKGNELKYVTEAISDEWVSTAGPFIDKFEKQIAAYLKTDQAVACQSGTAGLHLALQLCGVSSNDEVLVPALTFIAAVNPVKYCGAEPVFMDCDDTLNMDLDKLQEFINDRCEFTNDKLINKTSGRQIKAIVIVHVFGNICDMEKLRDIADKYNLKLVEDATEALGSRYTTGRYKDKYAGTIGDIGVYSFNGNKIITTGGGGMLVSPHREYLDKARYLSTQAKDDGLYYTHNEIGYNYRMTNLQAAVGLAQLEQLEDFIATKKSNYEYYHKQLTEIDGLKLLPFNSWSRPNYWFYSIIIDQDKYKTDIDDIITTLSAAGIQTRPVWGCIPKQKPYLTSQAYKVEKAFYYTENVLNLPCSSNLTEQDIDRVIRQLKDLKR